LFSKLYLKTEAKTFFLSAKSKYKLKTWLFYFNKTASNFEFALVNFGIDSFNHL